jgi:hypothetical protein
LEGLQRLSGAYNISITTSFVSPYLLVIKKRGKQMKRLSIGVLYDTESQKNKAIRDISNNYVIKYLDNLTDIIYNDSIEFLLCENEYYKIKDKFSSVILMTYICACDTMKVDGKIINFLTTRMRG